MGLFSKKQTVFNSPIKGEIATLASLKDGVFSEKMMGDGVVVKFPKDEKVGKVYAPTSGELVTVFPTGHAYGIKTKGGVEVLVHIGLDTVNLNGEGFKSQVKQGAKVKAGDLIATVELSEIRSKVPAVDPIIIVTSGQKLSDIATGNVDTSTEIFKIS